MIGVSGEPQKIGYIVFDNLLSSFGGRVFGVNPNTELVLGEKLYKTVHDVKEAIDLAIICVPAKIVPHVLESCGKKKIPYVVVISSGFSEVGKAGLEREQELKKIAKKHGIRILGPNCLGVINNFNNLNASFATSKLPAKYRVGVFSQSGAMGAAMLDFANGGGFGFSYFVSLGNKTDISEVDLIDSWANDDNVNVGVGYLEDIKDGQAFLKAARKFTSKKPLIILKGGLTKTGGRAASLHTAAMAQDEEVFKTAMKDAGVILAKNLSDLFELAASFADNPLPKGRNLVIISNAGGPSVVTADACEIENVNLPQLSARTVHELAQKTEAASLENPIDLRGDATSKDFSLALSLAAADSKVDGILVIASPQRMTEVDEIAWEIVRAKKNSAKPIYVNFLGGEIVESAREILKNNGVPSFTYPERAVRAFRFQANFRQTRIKEARELKKHHKHSVAQSVIRFSGDNMSYASLSKLLELYGLPMADVRLVKSQDEAKKALMEIKPPVVMKISSPDILHKTDYGGVILGVKDEDEAAEAYNIILKNIRHNFPKARINGVVVMEMAHEGLELIVGAKRDSTFGPVIMFGFGGILVELISDYGLAIAPFDRQKVRELIANTKVQRIIKGYRTSKKYSQKALEDIILGVGHLITDHPEIFSIEINPIVLSDNGQGALGLDAKIELQNKI
ncbi:acetate--CoA ligase family protein [Patescibacteria group bacterium]|nr:acetate--CoA ligase family protein [Patescibacteria group bacterium]